MRVSSVVTALVFVAHCDFAAAQISAPYYFDCDVPPERFSLFTAMLSSQTVEVRGSIELLEYRKDRRWASIASVLLASDDITKGAGLQLAVSPDEPDDVIIVADDGEESTQPEMLGTRPWKGQVIEFVLTLRESGELEVRALGESRVISFAGFTPRKLAFACSGAQFQFSDIVVSPLR
jgi:hypothetical protein